MYVEGSEATAILLLLLVFVETGTGNLDLGQDDLIWGQKSRLEKNYLPLLVSKSKVS